MNVKSESSMKKVSQEAFKTIEERYYAIIEQTKLIIFDINLKNNEIYISENFPEQVGAEYNKKAVLKEMLDLKVIHPDDITKFKHYLKKGKDGIPTDVLIYRRKRQSGEYAWIRSSRKNTYDEHGELTRVLGTIQDVSAEMNEHAIMKANAELDLVTDVPNSLRFTINTQNLFNKNKNKKYAIIVFDIDKFRIINDVYGSKEGDKVLKYIGDTLKRCIDKDNLYCRLYSDNFAILVEYKQDSDLALLAITLSEETAKYPLKYEITLSFGACIVEDSKTPITTLCDRASLAKKTVKGNVLQLLAFYDENLRKRDIEDNEIENEMALALENHEFVMYLQPKVAIATTEVVGAEALARWIHPIKGIIPPDRFIPLFEKNGFIIKLDMYMWEQAFATIRNWIDTGYKPTPISLNVSRIHLHTTNVVACFVKLANKYQVPRNLIEIELTETAFFENLEELSALAHELKQEGFILSMDDFGSGYSSLNMLKDVPVDIIKIDKGFMSEVVATERGKTVIQYTIAMAKQLEIDVIAEGVENFMQAEFLFEAGCETAQGYFYSKPLPIENFEQYTYGYSYK